MDFGDRFYRYEPTERIELTPMRSEPGVDLLRMSWRSPVHSGFPENDSAYAYYYRPTENARRMAVIVVHGWGGSVTNAERRLARKLALRGIHAVLPALPYHYDRTPEGHRSGAQFFDPEIASRKPPIFQGVLDIRCLADYFEGYTMGCTGTSLGGIISHLLMGVDPRFESGVTVAAGGNLLKMGSKGLFSSYFRKRMKRKSNGEDFRNTRAEFRDYWNEVQSSGEITAPPENWFLTDPLIWAVRNRPRNVIMINGLLDLIVPPSCVLDLRRALGRPRLVWLPTSHFSLFLFDRYIQRIILDFFESYSLWGKRSPLLPHHEK
jgi:hypothetical protein